MSQQNLPERDRQPKCSTGLSASWGDTPEERAMRREGEAATDKFRLAMQQAGHRPKPREVLSLKRPERSIDMPWPEARTTPFRVTINNIARDVAKRHGVTIDELRCAERSHRLIAARHEAFYLARTRTNAPLARIARYFRRDHSTVINGIQRHMAREGLQ